MELIHNINMLSLKKLLQNPQATFISLRLNMQTKLIYLM